jgi:hypothetical protein
MSRSEEMSGDVYNCPNCGNTGRIVIVGVVPTNLGGGKVTQSKEYCVCVHGRIAKRMDSEGEGN